MKRQKKTHFVFWVCCCYNCKVERKCHHKGQNGNFAHSLSKGFCKSGSVWFQFGGEPMLSRGTFVYWANRHCPNIFQGLHAYTVAGLTTEYRPRFGPVGNVLEDKVRKRWLFSDFRLQTERFWGQRTLWFSGNCEIEYVRECAHDLGTAVCDKHTWSIPHHFNVAVILHASHRKRAWKTHAIGERKVFLSKPLFIQTDCWGNSSSRLRSINPIVSGRCCEQRWMVFAVQQQQPRTQL